MLLIKEDEIEILPRKLQRTIEREADLVMKVTTIDGSEVIYNIEWQTQNDPKMCERMLVQQSVLYSKYKVPVAGIVIYIGKETMRMQTEIEFENFRYAYTLIDFSTYDPKIFLKSDVPEEIIMAILASTPEPEEARLLIRSILLKLRALLEHDTAELNSKVVQLEVLSEIKGFQKIIIEEEKAMPIILDNSKSIRFQQGLKAGIEKGIEKGIQKGMEKATRERNTTIVINLLQNTTHTNEQIAALVNVPLQFVLDVKKSLQR
jgi:predicted transposase/invertase (TIGR01784 family)